MRQLEYPRPISMENFKLPNFELVADILYWFVIRYEPSSTMSDVIDTESDRIIFIKQVVHLFASKARIKLNPKKIYEANGYAVKEMLKVATMLKDAMKAAEQQYDEEEDISSISMDPRLQNLKQAKSLASEITEIGAKLYDSLGNENKLRLARNKALDFLDNSTDQDHIEKQIRNLMGN